MVEVLDKSDTATGDVLSFARPLRPGVEELSMWTAGTLPLHTVVPLVHEEARASLGEAEFSRRSDYRFDRPGRFYVSRIAEGSTDLDDVMRLHTQVQTYFKVFYLKGVLLDTLRIHSSSTDAVPQIPKRPLPAVLPEWARYEDDLDAHPRLLARLVQIEENDAFFPLPVKPHRSRLSAAWFDSLANSTSTRDTRNSN